MRVFDGGSRSMWKDEMRSDDEMMRCAIQRTDKGNMISDMPLHSRSDIQDDFSFVLGTE